MVTDNMETICLRPHHGICIQNFIGKGYNEEFIKNMQAVIDKLESDKSSMIHLVSCSDDLCMHCPHNNGGCDSAEKVRTLDELCLRICGLSSGTYIRWSAFRDAVKKRILAADAFHNVCGKCEWYSLCKEIKQHIGHS